MIAHLSFLIFGAFANSSSLTFKIDGRNVNFFHNEQLRVTASKKCELGKDQNRCKNFGFLYKISAAKNGKIPEGNPNSASLTCEIQLDGKPVLGTDATGNQNSFCYLEAQNLYVDSGTLNFYASKNDGLHRGKSKFRGR